MSVVLPVHSLLLAQITCVSAGRPPTEGTIPAALLDAAPVFERSPDGVDENLLILLHGLGDTSSEQSPRLCTPIPMIPCDSKAPRSISITGLSCRPSCARPGTRHYPVQ